MNRELAEYMYDLKEDLGRLIWLYAIKKAARNGTVNLMYKDLLIKYRFKTKAELKEYFNPHEAVTHKVIKILVDTESFISINFRLGTKQEAGAVQQNLIKKTETDNLPTVQGTKEVATILKQPIHYIPNEKFVNELIGDYILFFKHHQIANAALVNINLELEQTITPKISGEDRKHIKELCVYFSKLPKVQGDLKIKQCFGTIYGNWTNLSDYIQSRIDLRHISQNINKIVIQIQNLNNGIKDKREQQINAKINRAQQKDYSRLARTRKKDN